MLSVGSNISCLKTNKTGAVSQPLYSYQRGSSMGLGREKRENFICQKEENMGEKTNSEAPWWGGGGGAGGVWSEREDNWGGQAWKKVRWTVERLRWKNSNTTEEQQHNAFFLGPPSVLKQSTSY